MTDSAIDWSKQVQDSEDGEVWWVRGHVTPIEARTAVQSFLRQCLSVEEGPTGTTLTMWTGSALGYSFHCRCGWVSGRFPTPAEAREHLRDHVEHGTHPTALEDRPNAERGDNADL